MRINQNIAALNTYNKLTTNNANTAKSLEKLSSGLRINRAGDDAAGLAISEKMRAQVRGLDQASRNSSDAISLIQTAEGALNETQSILQRMRELSVQAASDTNVTVDRGEIQKEMNQLTSEINRIGNTTEFNTMKLLDGSKKNGQVITTTITAASINSGGGLLVPTVADVTLASTKVPKFSGDNIAIAAGSSGNIFQGTTTSGTLSIWMSGTAAGGAYVMVSGLSSGDVAGTTNVSGSFIVSGAADGSYTFSGLGVSFKITDITGWDSGTTNLVSYTKASGTVIDSNLSTAKNLWTSVVSGGSGLMANFATLLSGGIYLDSGMDEGVYTISISSDPNNQSGAINITRSGLAGSGNFIVAHASGFTSGYIFNSNGISFSVAGLSGIGSGGSGTLTFTVQRQQSNTNTTGDDNSLSFQIGANQNQSLSLGVSDMRAAALGISSANGSGDFVSVSSGTNVTNGTNSSNVEYGLDVSTSAKASTSITKINDAIEKVSSERAKLGAVQNRLEHTINNLGTSSENLTAAESRIRDVDMAREMMNFTKNNILSQAAQSMLAQANQQPQGVLQLLR